jgi:hypothetical protein
VPSQNDDDKTDVPGFFKELGKTLFGDESDGASVQARKTHYHCGQCLSIDVTITFHCACGEFDAVTCGVPGCFQADAFLEMIALHAQHCPELPERINAIAERRRKTR